MPRHSISDAHEWINEIPTVPIYLLAKPRPRERAWSCEQRGKKSLLSLTLVWFCEMALGMESKWEPSPQGGGAGETPLPQKRSYFVNGPAGRSLRRWGQNPIVAGPRVAAVISPRVRWGVWLGRTSVIQERRCPKNNSRRTEISCGA